MYRFVYLGALIVVVSACTNSRLERAIAGPAVDLSADQVQSYQTNANSVVLQLAVLSGQATDDDKALKSNPDFGQIASAGFLVIDAACEDYLDALFWLDRGRRHTATQLGLTNAATAGALGILGASADAIALVGAGFGLATATIENLSQSLLYQLDPAQVRDLVRKTQASFLNSVDGSQLNTKTSALWHMASYANLCKPASIETEVVRALNASTPVSADVALDGAPPVVGLTNEQVTFSGATTSADQAVRAALNTYLERDRTAFTSEAQRLLTEQDREVDLATNQGALFELLTRPSERAFRSELLARLSAR